MYPSLQLSLEAEAATLSSAILIVCVDNLVFKDVVFECDLTYSSASIATSQQPTV